MGTQRRTFVAAMAVVALSLSACTGAGKPPSTINADLTEFKVVLSSAQAAAGTVTFTITNRGTVTHEFVVLKTDLATEKLQTTGDGEVDEESAELAGIDEIEDIAAGARASLKVDLEPGRYVLICNLAGHYGGGMRTAFEVIGTS